MYCSAIISPNLISLANLMLCLVIFLLGYRRYKKTGSECPGYIGVAFGVFAISHIMTLSGYQMILIFSARMIGYLLAIVALSKTGK